METDALIELPVPENTATQADQIMEGEAADPAPDAPADVAAEEVAFDLRGADALARSLAGETAASQGKIEVRKVSRSDHGTGLGLFATQEIDPGEKICIYYGEPAKRYQRVYSDKVMNGKGPNGKPFRFIGWEMKELKARFPDDWVVYAGQFANDGALSRNRKSYVTRHPRVNALCYQYEPDTPAAATPVFYLQSKRRIPAGEQILLAYGRAYWNV